MGHREVKRVPLDFSWPRGEVWEGFLLPERLQEGKCPDCENGYSPHGQYLHDLWYGYVPFDPASTGSAPWQITDPAVRDFARRNVERDPDFYGARGAGGGVAVVREAFRLASMWNGQWCHHLNQDDVNALVEAGRLMDFTHTWSREDRWQKKDPPFIPTATEVNEWSLRGMGHDSLNAGIAVSARCKREGYADRCPACEGHGSVEKYPSQRAEAEAWEPAEPPAGDGWQLWETTSEGSPTSPVFATAGELAAWCEGNATAFADMRWTADEWLRSFDGGDTSTDTLMIADQSGVHTLGPQ